MKSEDILSADRVYVLQDCNSFLKLSQVFHQEHDRIHVAMQIGHHVKRGNRAEAERDPFC